MLLLPSRVAAPPLPSLPAPPSPLVTEGGGAGGPGAPSSTELLLIGEDAHTLISHGSGLTQGVARRGGGDGDSLQV